MFDAPSLATFRGSGVEWRVLLLAGSEGCCRVRVGCTACSLFSHKSRKIRPNAMNELRGQTQIVVTHVRSPTNVAEVAAVKGTNCEFDHFPRSETILFSVRNLFEVTAPQVALHRSKSPRRRAPRPAAGPPTRAIADARARSHHGHRAATVTPQLQEADVDRDGRSA